MSFSQDIKDELLEQKMTKECCMIAERLGELATTNNDINLIDFDELLKNKCCLSAFLKGAFLGAGCIVDPESDYHLDIITQRKDYAIIIQKIMRKVKLKAKILERSKNYMIYIKDSNQIALFLSFIQATNSYLKYEQIRVEKDLKNNINRNINCETANMSKTITTSVIQIDAIEFIKKCNEFDKLSPALKEAAELREKYNELSLRGTC